ncbi:MAG: YcjF family protein [Terrimicrobiaceae bacterium]
MNIPISTEVERQDALLAICLFAAFADGDKSGEEREHIHRLAGEIGSENLSDLSRQILMRKLALESVVSALRDRQDRMLAYELALGVCEAGGAVSAEEKEFLTSLRGHLQLGRDEAGAVEDSVASVALAPVEVGTPAAPVSDNGGMILNYSILNGALELLPETLATMAIVPLQMKMVFRIAKSHGVEPGASNIKEFLATAGLGLGSQMVEGFARKLMRGVGKSIGGKMAGRAADQITGSAFSFASTYAIGHVAEKYYSGGSRIDSASLKSLFVPLRDQAKELHAKYLPEIQARAKTLDPAAILSIVKGSTPV